MQMEPWRKRGFVPDSDDDEEFDSLEASEKAGDDISHPDVDLEYLPIPASTTVIESKSPVEDHIQTGHEALTGLSDAQDVHRGSVELASSPVIKRIYNEPSNPPPEEPAKNQADHAEERLRSLSPKDQTPKPRKVIKTYGKRSTTKRRFTEINDENDSQIVSPNLEHSIYDIRSSPPAHDWSARRSRRLGRDSTPKPSTPTKELQSPAVLQTKPQDAQSQNLAGRSRSSSPDDLIVVEHPPTKPLTENEVEKEGKEDIILPDASDDDSPLSSPPSSLHSPVDKIHLPQTSRGESQQNTLLDDQEPLVSGDKSQQDALVEDIPQIEIPQELLDQMQTSQPTRRTFRERNAIQMHPYALEMAKYQRLMKEGGIRPVRAMIEEQRKRAKEATDESQEQDEFDPDALRSSSPPEEFLPQRTERRLGEETNDGQSHHSKKSNSPLKRIHSAKRLRKSPPGARDSAKPGVLSRPQVVINTTTPPSHRPKTTILDPIFDFFSSSPPNSDGALSGAQTPRASEGFRFPPGFTPPTVITPVAVESESTTPHAKEQPTVDLISEPESDGELSDSSQASSAAPGETAEEREIRRIQRQTRGVLPASWIRLEARQRLEQQKASQQNRNNAAPRMDGKGVARKIIRKPGLAGRTTSLIDFGDSDDSEEELNSRADTQNAENDDAEKTSKPATPFDDHRTGDLMEDNRIDYMLPTVSRPLNQSGRRKSLKRPKPKESAYESEQRAKKARLKRQTRLTDGSYGARKTKQPSKRAVPRLGILDAPDVAACPREEQPQFLRIAARRARSRKDVGRQSPTRKFFQLSSKLDTTEANQSLREWRRGKIKQSKSVRPQSKPQKRQPAASLTNMNLPIAQFSQRTEHPERPPARQPTEPDVVMVDDDDLTGQENVPPSTAPPPPQAPPSENTPAVRPAQLERHGHQWVVRRNMPISSLQRNAARPAVTSVVAPKDSQALSKSVFSRSLKLLNRDYRHKHHSRAFQPNLTLERYISGTQSVGQAATQSQNAAQKQQPKRRLKKSTPRRVIVDPADSPENDTSDVVEIAQNESNSGSVNQLVPAPPTIFSLGLFNWQSSYSLDFGVQPLRNGTFFHESTFIGSGEFSQSLQLAKRNLDNDARSCSVTIKDQNFHWGPWNDTVSSQMGSVFEFMIAEFERSMHSTETDAAYSLSSASLAYRSMINYVTEHLSFIDPVDRKGFLYRIMGLITWFREPMSVFIASRKDKYNEIVGLACYNLVFANQARQISAHQLVDAALGKEAADLVRASANDVISIALSESGLKSVHDLLEEVKKSNLRDKGIHDEFPSAAAFIIAGQLLRSSGSLNGVLADIQLEACTTDLVQNQKDVANLERAWRKLFTTLPLDEIDHNGIARHDSRKTMQGNWNLVKKLLSPALDDTDTNSARLPISFNSYCRVLFQRCHRLINAWGWRECKPILDTLYDFFALKSLNNLRLEESRGSPAFLDELNSTPSLDIKVGEPCFHTLLKILASGLRSMALRYDKKKMRNFAWRLLPNHGRVYPKDKELRHEDLDALRNHHDLLCTLYWSVPDGCRPRLETIRDLVHPATSHQETCSINIQSWIRLAKFKLSTNEDVSDLDPFAEWHSYFMVELQQQHSQARSEIETQNKDNKFASKELVESTISRNQRQIESLLKMGLSGLRTSVELAPSLEHAHRLISKTPFDSLIGLFNPKTPRVNSVVSEALKVIMAYITKHTALPVTDVPNPAPVAPIEEDSQEFEGFDDWSDIHAVLAEQNEPREEVEHMQRVLYPVVHRLLSNCFGADNSPEDDILMNVVDSWATLACALVRHGLQRWDNYLSQFGDRSWAQLRQTLQTRKYAAQFLALCIEKDTQIVIESRNLVIGMWMSSLVERSSMLKFQHRLTEALLNGNPRDLILKNLPFVKDERDNRYHVSLQDLSQRRVSLLSSILSNMRDHVLQLEISGSRDLGVTKQEYSEVLQQLMTAMKDNYRELGNGAVESAQGAYVEFVHRIIRFLQELASDIRPVDPFFTDPALFPLPSTDPRYIVAKLKRYEPKLSSNKEVQTLTMFVQSIVERATVERQQVNLVEQLHTAMKDTYEAGRSDRPTLRAVLMQSVFPAYLQLSFSTKSAWILSRPIIQSISLMFKDLLFSINTKDPACVSSLLLILDTVFQSSHRALQPLSTCPRRFKDPVKLYMLAQLLKMVSSTLVVLDYLDRLTADAESLIPYVQWFKELSTAVSFELSDSASDLTSDVTAAVVPALDLHSSHLESEIPPHLITSRRSALADHQSYLKNWSLHDGKYYYSRSGHESKEVTLDPETSVIVQDESKAMQEFDDAKAEFSDILEQFELIPM